MSASTVVRVPPSMTVQRARELLARHATPPKPASPAVRHCQCGQVLARGARFGPGLGERTPVLICWECGYEEPSLYGRSRSERNGHYIGSPQRRWARVKTEGTPRWRYS